MTIKSSIAETKDNLPKYIHEAETGNDICITRHGKAVAMLISMERYKTVVAEEKDKGIYGAIMAWRTQLNNPELNTPDKQDVENKTDSKLWTDKEIDALRDKSPARGFSWE